MENLGLPLHLHLPPAWGYTYTTGIGAGGERWVKHYSSSHQILLVGEGDFSFSLSLALAFRSAFNIVATSLDSYYALLIKYSRASSNLEQLRALGATILHEVNVKNMKDHFQLCNRKFDRIVFNFPHAGFYGKEGNPEMIQMHQGLVREFFSNARWLLQNNGEIHVSHKNSAPYCHWNLEELARENSLLLFDSVPFNIADYPYYQNKRGDGLKSDEPFILGDCSTLKFVACHPPSFHETSMHLSNALSSVIFNMGTFRFMVKGSVRVVYPGAAGYGGALVNPENAVIATLSGPLPQVEPDVAELLAVKQALLMFERSKLCGKVGLIVESDSTNAVSWIKSDFRNPWELLPDIEEISMAITRIGNVNVQCSFGEFGVGTHHLLVDKLVEQGFDMKCSFERWC